MSEHLSTEQIIEFVAIDELTEETKAKMSAVNAHIFHCKECATRVRAYLEISEEFERIGKKITDGCNLEELYNIQQPEQKKQELQELNEF